MIKIAAELVRCVHPLLWPVAIPLAACVVILAWTALQLVKVFGLLLGIPWNRW